MNNSKDESKISEMILSSLLPCNSFFLMHFTNTKRNYLQVVDGGLQAQDKESVLISVVYEVSIPCAFQHASSIHPSIFPFIHHKTYQALQNLHTLWPHIQIVWYVKLLGPFIAWITLEILKKERKKREKVVADF